MVRPIDDVSFFNQEHVDDFSHFWQLDMYDW